jgi:pilus assembly protein Flp/PilA
MWGVNVFRKTQRQFSQASKRRGSIFVEYLLLATIVGIGVIAGVATVRTALHNELIDLANAIGAIIGTPQNYMNP